jgi:hypothetical protein
MVASTAVRLFDLNIEKILEGWALCHGVRELIANALDEQSLTGTQEIKIYQEQVDRWHIRDFGRGLKYEHLTQNENQEKLSNPSKVIGRFGVGLKDALATLSRHNVEVTIHSKFGDIALRQTAKYGFSDVVTLHAAISQASDSGLEGTDIILNGISVKEIEEAKSFFLKFSGDSLLEQTQYGQIFTKVEGHPARIYVNGIVVAEEENFAFSYNITSLTSAMRRALNRERTNVGRTAYSDRVKAMLLACNSEPVAMRLASELDKVQLGTSSDEVGWLDVAVHACQILNSTRKVLFVTTGELIIYPEAIDRAKTDGYRVVSVPENVRLSLRGLKDITGNAVRDLSVYEQEWQQSFEFKFIQPEQLTARERDVFARWKDICRLIGGMPKQVKELLISETMRPSVFGDGDAQGLWESANGRIIVKRCQLGSLADFAGTLLHEIVHASTGFGDVNRDFELALTEFLGIIASEALS